MDKVTQIPDQKLANHTPIHDKSEAEAEIEKMRAKSEYSPENQSREKEEAS